MKYLHTFDTKEALNATMPTIKAPWVVLVKEDNSLDMHSDKDMVELFNTQIKSIEITENGTTVVTPDAGYGSMCSVNIKTNVPKGGYTYFDCFGERAMSDYYSYIGASMYNKSDH